MTTYLATLYPNPPYAFDTLLNFLSRFAYPTTDHVQDGVYRRAFRSDKGMALVEVRGSGTVDAPVLEVHLLAQSGDIQPDGLLRHVAHVLAVDADRSAFFNAARAHDHLWRVVEPAYGMPAMRTADMYEALVSAIIEQQILWTAAQRAQRWLVEWGNHALHHNGASYFAYPTPEQLAAAAIDDLKPLKITFKRMQMLIDLSRQIIAGAFDLDALARQPHDDIYRALLQIKGIGHWTAAVTVERTLGAPVFVAQNDVALQAAVNHYYFGAEKRATPQQVADTFGQFGYLAGQAAYYTLVRWVLDRY